MTIRQILIKPVLFSLVLGLAFSCGVQKSKKQRPDISAYSVSGDVVNYVNDTLRFSGSNSLRKNRFGQWEFVGISENPLDLGNSFGLLTADLMKQQEEIFFGQVNEFVPSKFKQGLLKKYLAWYNRKMYQYVLTEYQTEIYGMSRFMSDQFDDIAPKYLRSLYLHGAHDIGHAVRNMISVGCTSFAAWGDHTEDGSLLMGRNFDFYINDEFARNKIIAFVKPSEGHAFMSVTWAGMIGVVSGMNDQGLCVTINAARSSFPKEARTPISLVTREIVQYAKNIEEAIAIARKREVFVAESILVGSAADNRAVIIEISPDNFGVYEANNSDAVVCSNHYQSETYGSDKNNTEFKENSHSEYRLERMWELLDHSDQLNVRKAVDMLRDRNGLNDKIIGYGNEKAINQLLAHHGIVFSPKRKMVWVSSNPYNLGEFVAFNLDSIFESSTTDKSSLSIGGETIGKDVFLDSEGFSDYEHFRKVKKRIEYAIEEKDTFGEETIKEFISLNPDFWEVYSLTGEYYYHKKDYRNALFYFNKALQMEITTLPDQRKLELRIKKIKRKLRDTRN